jgi:hypothetical protein
LPRDHWTSFSLTLKEVHEVKKEFCKERDRVTVRRLTLPLQWVDQPTIEHHEPISIRETRLVLFGSEEVTDLLLHSGRFNCHCEHCIRLGVCIDVGWSIQAAKGNPAALEP